MLEVAAIIFVSGIILFSLLYSASIFIGRKKSKEGINANYWHEYSENPYNSYTNNDYRRSKSQDDACD